MSDKGSTGHFGQGTGINRLPNDSSQLSHIFGSRIGHLSDTPANRQLLIDVTNDSDNFLGKDKRGNAWYTRIENDGTQVWAVCRKGIIQNGGKNDLPFEWSDESGLNKNPFRKEDKK